MTALGLGDIQAFPFVEAPDKRNIQDGVRLQEFGAINAEAKDAKKRLTSIGRQHAFQSTLVWHVWCGIAKARRTERSNDHRGGIVDSRPA